MKIPCLSFCLIFSIGSCAPKSRTNQLVPQVNSSTQTGESVLVKTTVGSDRSRIEGLEVASRDFRQALETSLVDSGLFQRIGGDGYQLEASILSINNPAAVFSVTTEIEVDYTLRRSGAIVWKKSVRSYHVTETGESMISDFRNRMSTEGAMRENIRVAISSMSEKLR